MEQTNNTYRMILLSSLTKVFTDEEPLFYPECCRLTGLYGETVSFQTACSFSGEEKETLQVSIDSPLEKQIRIRQVISVPSAYPAHKKRDNNYLRHTPGLYPDLLRNLDHDSLLLVPGKWQSLWVDVSLTSEINPGIYPIKVSLINSQESIAASVTATLEIIPASLPSQELIHTQWFHGDCLADYYHVPVFSEEHWTILEHFISLYAKRGMNMILTPIFTPPLDTARGGERTTIQLVDILEEDGTYQFDFTRLQRWVSICKASGIRYFEMAHLFTQWGAESAPKILVTTNRKVIKRFGWHTPALGDYTHFLNQFLPALKAELKHLNILDDTWFHISDEPKAANFNSYAAARESIMEHLKGCKMIDALSDYSFYESGLVERPVCATDHIDPFLHHSVPHLWSYYCTAQCVDVANRFMAMPSERNRIYGLQVYKFGIEGILHWGFNFYNSEYSLEHINPYLVTDSGGSFPSGDGFLVYPGADRYPEESIRLMVLYEAIQDHRALKLLEQYIGREAVIDLLEEDLSEPITFQTYPKSAAYLISVRNKINRMLKQFS
ncbi:DUF4091 domain-containing protein [Lacrimispora defluvii]|uniref:DUF4091 domain-containing protein n=1 Tax=Lacrimispora defluvii TaxID=2719233 RepID=A0ABX1VVM2_9FIRM|nr:DUF4091 domain-containing protein [Lacrimispora defluvii]NNJ30263.1 DUF4091 domain-containing protein [Lacrimispora defluvii]